LFIGYDHHLLGQLATDHIVSTVITALDEYIGRQRSDEFDGSVVVEHNDVIDVP
jgi:hypothetical protein